MNPVVALALFKARDAVTMAAKGAWAGFVDEVQGTERACTVAYLRGKGLADAADAIEKGLHRR